VYVAGTKKEDSSSSSMHPKRKVEHAQEKTVIGELRGESPRCLLNACAGRILLPAGTALGDCVQLQTDLVMIPKLLRMYQYQYTSEHGENHVDLAFCLGVLKPLRKKVCP